MPKRVTAFELMLPVREPETPVYRWIHAALRTEILEGRCRRADALRCCGRILRCLPYQIPRETQLVGRGNGGYARQTRLYGFMALNRGYWCLFRIPIADGYHEMFFPAQGADTPGKNGQKESIFFVFHAKEGVQS
jgi:hypothetical protein